MARTYIYSTSTGTFEQDEFIEVSMNQVIVRLALQHPSPWCLIRFFFPLFGHVSVLILTKVCGRHRASERQASFKGLDNL